MENQSNLELNKQAIDALNSSAKWSLFLAIMGFIGIGFMIIGAIFMGSIMTMIPDDGSPLGKMRGFISVIYIILAALYFPPVYYLYKYSSDMKSGLYSKNSNTVSDALVALKTHHKYLGISIIVIIGLYIIGIIGVVFFAVSQIR